MSLSLAKALLLFGAMAILPSFVGAQLCSVNGTIIDSVSKEPLYPVQIILKSTKNPNFSRYAGNNEQGFFQIENLPEDSYTLQFFLIGYITKYGKAILNATTPSIKLGTITLSEESQSIDGVEITAQANPIIIKKDTLEYVASAHKVSENSQVEDLLKKMQGVEIERETGKITVNGKVVKKIMIDGKVFFGGDPTLATKNLPANMVDKVQVVDRKSDQAQFTGMDDGNEETIINLVVKPGMKEGWMGNFSGSGGRDIRDNGFTDAANNLRFSGGGVLNRFKDKQQISLILSGNNTNNQGFTDIVGEQARASRGRGSWSSKEGITTSYMGGVSFADDLLNDKLKIRTSYLFNNTTNESNSQSSKTSFITLDSIHYNKNLTRNQNSTFAHRLNAEIDWSIDSMHSILFKPTINVGANSSNDTSLYNTTSNQDTINFGSRKNTGDTKTLSTSGDLLYRLKFRKPGRTISTNITVDYSQNFGNEYNLSNTKNHTDNISAKIDQRADNNSRNIGYLIRTSYTEPLGKNFFVGVSYGFNQRIQKRNRQVFEADNTKLYNTKIDALSSIFDNNFMNHDAEITLQKREIKYIYTVGGTLQPSTMVSMNKDTTLRRNVLNYAPNADFTYNFSQTHQLRLDYRGKTTQPSISQLQPVIDNSDPLYQRIGNYDLIPEFTHTLNFRYRRGEFRSSRVIFFRGSFNFTQDKIINSTSYGEGGKQIVKPVNTKEEVYSANIRGGFNTAINSKHDIWKLFYISDMINSSYSTGLSITNDKITKNNNLNVGNRLRFSYRGTFLDGGIFAKVDLRKTWYSLQGKQQPLYITHSYGLDALLTISKIGLTLGSDYEYTAYVGYSQSFSKPIALWNAEITQILYTSKVTSGKVLSLKLRVVDLLNQSNSRSLVTTDNYIQESSTNVLGRYFLFTLGFRFGSFGNLNKRRA